MKICVQFGLLTDLYLWDGDVHSSESYIALKSAILIVTQLK
jgi:hypothetical protein